MGLFPTDAGNGDQVTNTYGTTFEYVAADDKWVIVNTVAISDVAYDEGTWDGNLDSATKNAIRDKIEVMAAEAHAYVEANALTLTQNLTLSDNIELILEDEIKLYDVDGDGDSETSIYMSKAQTALRLWTKVDGSYVAIPLYLYNTDAYEPALFDNFPNNINFEGDLTVANLITAGLVDGEDVSDLAADLALQCTTQEAHDYIEATALFLANDLDLGDNDIENVGTVYHDDTTRWLVRVSADGTEGGTLYDIGLYWDTTPNTLSVVGYTNLNLGMQSDHDVIDITSAGVRIGGAGARITTIEDNDGLGTSDTKLCTQGNVKAYVDAAAGGAVALDDITDVVVTSVANNEVLAYDTGGNWINQTAAEAGLATSGHTHSLAGDVTGDIGSTVVGNDSHTHNTQYFTEAEMNAYLGIGTGNKRYVHLISTGGYRYEKDLMQNATGFHGNRDSEDFITFYEVPLPLTMGSKHLHVDYVYVYLYDADSSDYLNNFNVLGINTTSTSTLYNNATNYTTTGLKSFSTGTDDWGDYKAVRVGVNVVCTTQLQWEMSQVYVRCWYA